MQCYFENRREISRRSTSPSNSFQWIIESRIEAKERDSHVPEGAYRSILAEILTCLEMCASDSPFLWQKNCNKKGRYETPHCPVLYCARVPLSMYAKNRG